MIQAIKNAGTSKEQSKQFSEEVWRFMGKNKNGWVKVSDSVAENTVTKKAEPSTGEKGVATNQVAENTATKKEEQVATNNAEKVENTAASTDNTATTDAVSQEEQNKKDFFALVKENLTKNVIKNYLDDDAVNIPYKATTVDEFSEILYTHFNGNIAELKSTFKID